jgi:hypothetical protein
VSLKFKTPRKLNTRGELNCEVLSKNPDMKNFIFSCVLFVLSSTTYAAQLSEHEGTKSGFEDASPVSLFTYDAANFPDNSAATSIFIHPKNGLLLPNLVNDHFGKIGVGKLNGMVEKQEKPHNRKSGINALNMEKRITFFALVKEQSPTNSLDEKVAEKLEQSDIYASKYYPQKISNTVQGSILHLEARIKLPVLVEHLHELLQLIIFVDSSPITISSDQNTWARELKQTTINGAGIGINWNYIDNFAFQAYFASEQDSQILGISPTISNLYWIQAVRFY